MSRGLWVRLGLLVACAVLSVLAVHPPLAWASANANWAPGVAVDLPGNANSTAPETFLGSVSCPSVGDCAAAGRYLDSAVHFQSLLVSESSGVWAPGVQGALPAGASTNPLSGVNSVSCPAPGDCSAVGDYRDTSNTTQGVLWAENSGAWGPGVKAPLPIGAGGGFVNSVSCASSGNCGAVGEYTDSSGHTQGLLLSETNGIWATEGAALPMNAGVDPTVGLRSVSCSSAGDCSAVGTYIDTSSDDHGLLLTESAGAWEPGVDASLPANAGTQGSTSVNFSVNSVSCASPGNCAAVGQYADNSGHTQGLLLTETAGTWATGVEAPLPANARVDPSVILNSVSCSSVGNCTAVGHYFDSSGHSQGLLLTETTGVWAGVEAGLPANAGTVSNVVMSSVSCASAGNCSAGGQYNDTSGHMQGLLLTESSGTWATAVEAASPDAAANATASVQAVSCASARNCAGVGEYDGASSQGLLLTAAPATPTLSAGGPPSATTGSAISPSSIAATLTGGSAPIGMVTFTVFGPQPSPPASCAPGGTTVGSASVLGDGTSHPSAGFTPAAPGDYWWFASYGGDPSDNPATSVCGAGMAETIATTGTTSAPPPTVGTKPQAPALSAVRLGSKRFAAKKGTKLRLTLSQSAKVKVVITQTVKGHKVKHACRRTAKKGKKCTLTITKRTLSFPGKAGRNAFQLKLRRLAKGRYTAAISAQNTNGKSGTVRLKFTIIHG